MPKPDLLPRFFLLLALLTLGWQTVVAQTTAFTYQGRLTEAGNPANGPFDFQFKLFDTQPVGTGTQQGGDVNVANVTVTNGSFSVQLEFGVCPACFNGAARFLEIAVKPTSSGTFTTLGPRQPITSTPYAIRSQNAATATLADGLSVACVSCVTSSQIASVNGSVVSGTIPVASLPAGSLNYIQNTTSPQAGSDFNISGNGTAGGILSGNLVNAATQFNLGGSRVLSATGENLFAGINAGTTGNGNSFFGSSAGQANTSSFDNAFFGFRAGVSNTTGSQNSFFGRETGASNTTGVENAFFGFGAGFRNTEGRKNTFIGHFADFTSTNTTGNLNTALGYQARVNSGLSNATAIGALARVDTSDSLVLGNFANVGIGTTAPLTKLDVRGDLALDPGGNPTLYTSVASTEQNRYLHLINSPSAPSASGLKAGGILVADDYGYGSPTKNDLIVKGFVGIGLGANVAPANPLHVAGDIRIGIGFTGCVLDADGTVIAGTCSSDARLKRDIMPFAHLLDKVAQLQPAHFYWRAEEFKDRHFGTKPSFGLIAQEVEKVLPELVTEDEQGYKAVNYSKLPLLTLQAIKELKAENDALKQRLSEPQASAALQQQQNRQLKKQQTRIERQQREIGELRQVVKALQSSIHNQHRK